MITIINSLMQYFSEFTKKKQINDVFYPLCTLQFCSGRGEPLVHQNLFVIFDG